MPDKKINITLKDVETMSFEEIQEAIFEFEIPEKSELFDENFVSNNLPIFKGYFEVA
jgi:hypothetical protein